MAATHLSVLFTETLDALVHRPEGVYVDVTFGRGGHTQGLLDRLSPHGRVIAIDRDPAAIEAGRAITDPRLSLHHTPFSGLPEVLQSLGIDAVDGLMADLGVSSPQLDEADRGFSFLRDGPLDMRMDSSSGPTAADWLAAQTPEQLAEVLATYGEERHARPIAQAICARVQAAQAGQDEPLATTLQLANLVASVLRRFQRTGKSGKSGRGAAGIHPATRTFQAIRIAVNRELDEVDALLEAAPRCIRPGGRMAIISFHSLEDRRVKQAITPPKASDFLSPRERRLAELAGQAAGIGEQQPRAGKEDQPPFRALARVFPSADEQARNPRARSAVLRVAERLGGGAKGQPKTQPLERARP